MVASFLFGAANLCPHLTWIQRPAPHGSWTGCSPLDDPGTAIGLFLGQGGERMRGLFLPHPLPTPVRGHCPTVSRISRSLDSPLLISLQGRRQHLRVAPRSFPGLAQEASGLLPCWSGQPAGTKGVEKVGKTDRWTRKRHPRVGEGGSEALWRPMSKMNLDPVLHH